ncbi:tetratricopeptide repeat protein [Streptomyces sp. HUAS ZL42]|uniref:tetratricopeptide repeat protein n=1 Tax=Streptomyces sp. HUAS ZL42 TaxID=3231715 RepID=UPI00345ED74F
MQAGEGRTPDRGRYDDHVDFRQGTFLGPVAAQMNVIHHDRPAPPPPSTLPTAQAGFIGRKRELAVLGGELEPAVHPAAPDAPVVCVVTGLGGIGKTALALKAAHRARARGWFTGGTLFLDLAGYDDNPVTPAQAVTSLLYALGVGAFGLPTEEVDQYAVYRSHLADLADHDRRVLLVLDNVSDSAQVSPLLPGSGPHCVLITSRESHESLIARELPLGPLSPDESAELIGTALHRRTPDDDRPLGEADAVRELARLCGHMPLALRIATALLHRRRAHRPLTSLVEELRAGTDPTRVLRSRGVDEYGRALAMAPVFEVSFRRLPPGRARALCLLAQVPCPDFSTDTVAVATGLDRTAVLDLLDDLMCAHLVSGERPGDDRPERWRIHDLVRGYASTLAADPALVAEGRRARQRTRRHYRTMAEAADRHLRALHEDPPPGTFTGRADALAWCDAERVNLVAAAQWPDEQDAADTLGLALHLAEFLRERRFFEDWIAVSRVARDIAHRLQDRHAEATVCNHLGNALLRAGRSEEALEPVTYAADLFHRLADPTGEGLAWNILGLAQRRVDRAEEAVFTHLRARDRFRATGARSLEGRAWHNLGLALEATGRLDEAADALRQACAIHHATRNRILQGDSLNGLGCALHTAGRTDQAVVVFQESLRIRQEYDNWYATSQTWNNLARALEAAGRPDEAADARDRAAEASSRAGTTVAVYGHYH